MMNIPIIDASQVIQGRQKWKDECLLERQKRMNLENQLKDIETKFKEFQERLNKIHQLSAM